MWFSVVVATGISLDVSNARFLKHHAEFDHEEDGWEVASKEQDTYVTTIEANSDSAALFDRHFGGFVVDDLPSLKDERFWMLR